MDTQNQQNSNQPTFWQRNFWGIIAAIFLFLLIFQIKSPLWLLWENKQKNEIIDAINKNGDKTNTGLNDLGKRLGDKIDTTNRISKEILDTLKEVKKDTRKIADKNCCEEKPPKQKPCPEKKPTVKPKPKVEPCKDCDTTKKVVIAQKPKCEYILWNPDHTKKKIFYSAEARQKFADEHGLIIHVQD